MEECRPVELPIVVKAHKHAGMSRHTMSFALPGSMREYIDNRVAFSQRRDSVSSCWIRACISLCRLSTTSVNTPKIPRKSENGTHRHGA